MRPRGPPRKTTSAPSCSSARSTSRTVSSCASCDERRRTDRRIVTAEQAREERVVLLDDELAVGGPLLDDGDLHASARLGETAQGELGLLVADLAAATRRERLVERDADDHARRPRRGSRRRRAPCAVVGIDLDVEEVMHLADEGRRRVRGRGPSSSIALSATWKPSSSASSRAAAARGVSPGSMSPAGTSQSTARDSGPLAERERWTEAASQPHPHAPPRR